MKRFIHYISAFITAAVVLASCDINKLDIFDDANAFVAFDQVSINIDETYSEVKDEEGNVIPGEVKPLRVPVTLASVAGIEESISFKVVDGTAKEGEHFELLTTSGVLKFNKENRTQYIEFKIINYPYYTGDLSFSIEFVNTNSVAQGAENKCTVKIGDVDHPLANLFGTYTVSGRSYYDDGGASVYKWTMTAYKDDKDDSKIWLLNIPYLFNGFETVVDYYGVVDADCTTITIPFGQATPSYKYSGTADVILYGIDTAFSVLDSGNVVVKILKDDSGKVTGLDFGTEYGFYCYIDGAGPLSAILPGVTATKN